MNPSTIAYTLPNGLLVLIREMHTAPVATCWIWYRVGARSEPPGLNGMIHWLEHMLFFGTDKLPTGAIDRIIARNGGISNGFTSLDFTAYFETLPADRIDLALQIESDRMINARVDPMDVESERSVILSELETYHNYPETWLDEAVKAAAFTTHPYRHPIGGYRESLLSITRHDLYTFYQTYYVPNNAVLVLAGDIEVRMLMAEVERYFAHLPPRATPTNLYAVEPEPKDERRVVVQRPGTVEYVTIAYPAPACTSPDFPALVVLDTILSGAKSWGSYGGAQNHRSSRIYKALVDTSLAVGASSSYGPTVEPFLFELDATVRLDRRAADVEAALLGEIERVQQDGVSQTELVKAVKQTRAQLAYSMESITDQGLVLGMWELLDDHKRLDTLLEELVAVTADNVRQVAQAYLTKQRRVVGWLQPSEPA